MCIKKLECYLPLYQIFAKCHQKEKAAFLDSSLVNELGRYSILGLNPYLEILEQDGICYVNQKQQSQSFEQLLKQYLEEHKEENPTDLPMISGGIGYFSYDYGRKFEQIKSRHKKQFSMPDACICFYDDYIIEDISNQILYISSKGMQKDAYNSMNEITAWIETLKAEYEERPWKMPPKHEKRAAFNANFTKHAYQDTIARMIQYIIEGDIYIANMTQNLTIRSQKDPYEMFEYLRTHNPAPFGAYLNAGDFQIISASMERFLQVKDGWVETRPIKGTRKRGVTPKEDAELRQELQDSGKDRSELLMIVDLLRNDLSRVCRPGSVKVTEHFAVQTYATVFHLVSTIIGQLRPGYGITELMKAAFPGGSITGAPKIRAMEIIDELEQGRRGIYTGSIGYLSLDGSCDLNIAIRTALYHQGTYYLGVGGGITCESETEFEYEETLQKAKAVLEAIYHDKD